MIMHRCVRGERALMPPSVCTRPAWLPGDVLTARAGGRKPASVSAGDGLPDQLGHVDDQIGSGLSWIGGGADLAGAEPQASAGPGRAGTVTCTRVPAPGAVTSSRSPPTAPARSVIVRRPRCPG